MGSGALQAMENTSKRRRRKWLAGIGVVGVGVLVFVLLYFEPQTAFIDDEVSETIPGLDVALATATTGPTTTATSATAADVSIVPTTVVPTVVPATVEVPSSDDRLPSTDDATGATLPPTPPTTAAATTAPAVPANSLAFGLASASATGTPVIVSTGTFISGEHDTCLLYTSDAADE